MHLIYFYKLRLSHRIWTLKFENDFLLLSKMICDQLKFIFIDICKTAGTSINIVLYAYILEHFGYYCYGKHHSIKNITGDFDFCTNITPEQLNTYFKFTIVRNPWDRMVSLWFWGISKEYPPSFREFIYNIRDGVYTEYNRLRYIQMLDWITDDAGNLKVDFIGRYENLQQDFDTICSKIGLPPLQLVCINTAKDRAGIDRTHYSVYYDEELKNIVAELFKKDIDYFGYIFESQ